MCSVFWLFRTSCPYLPNDWLERLLWGSLIVERRLSLQSPGRRVIYNFRFNVLFHCFIMCLSCPPAVCDIFCTPMIWYSLFCAEIAVKTHQLTVTNRQTDGTTLGVFAFLVIKHWILVKFSCTKRRSQQSCKHDLFNMRRETEPGKKKDDEKIMSMNCPMDINWWHWSAVNSTTLLIVR